ncbi:MAG: methylmalonyl-CoA mutase [Dehalococcoidales bacterium]|nr:methylmalonyl-CoA mutase [Dehalococcoidales bacterium]
MSGTFSEKFLEQIRNRREEWETGTLKKSLERFGVDEPPDQFYTPLDVKDWDFMEKVGFPGTFPFTAGIYACHVPGAGPVTGGGNIGATGKGMVRAGRYSGYGMAEDTRDFYQKEIQRGRVVGPNLAFDLPTQIGIDSDDPRAEGEVGKVGVAVDSLQDFEIIYEPYEGANGLDKIASNWTTNAQAFFTIAAYIALAQKKGIDPKTLRGTPQNDILKEYVARGTYIYPPKESLRLFRDILTYCTENTPRLNICSIAAYHMREGGATREQALAFHFANAITYLQIGVDAGLNVDDFVGRFSFNTLSGDMEIMKEIAARRAARRMWARIVRDRFGSQSARSQIYREAGGFVVGCVSSTKQRPLNNLTRTVIGGVAGAFCGYIPSVEPPYDEALGLGWSTEAQQLSEDAARIIQYESKLTEVIDPLAGSYYIEALTDQIEQDAWDIIKEIDEMGGSMKAIENGYMQRAVAQSAYEKQRRLESGEDIVVGVNAFTDETELEVLPQQLVPYPYDPNKQASAEVNQVKKLQQLRKDRDNEQVAKAIAQLKEAAQDESANLMVPTVEAVKVYATIGEVCGALREVFGEYSTYGTL